MMPVTCLFALRRVPGAPLASAEALGVSRRRGGERRVEARGFLRRLLPWTLSQGWFQLQLSDSGLWPLSHLLPLSLQPY